MKVNRKPLYRVKHKARPPPTSTSQMNKGGIWGILGGDCLFVYCLLLASPYGWVTTAYANYCGPMEYRHWGWSLPEMCFASELNTGIVRLRNSATFLVPTPSCVRTIPCSYLWLATACFSSFGTRDWPPQRPGGGMWLTFPGDYICILDFPRSSRVKK